MKKDFIYEIFGYCSILLVIIGQVVVGWAYIIGQCCFVAGNTVSTIRCFKIDLPTADKVKNVCFLAISIGLAILGIWKS